MKPVYQTLTEVDPARGRYGNCFQAAIASVLEMELDAVPHFAQLGCEATIARGVAPEDAFKNSSDWFYLLNDWLKPRGLSYIEFTEPENWSEAITSRLGYHLIVGLSPRGEHAHVVVGEAGRVVHDPRADADPEGPALRSMTAFGIFLPLDPARMSAPATHRAVPSPFAEEMESESRW
jgi:hypothetical protein